MLKFINGKKVSALEDGVHTASRMKVSLCNTIGDHLRAKVSAEIAANMT